MYRAPDGLLLETDRVWLSQFASRLRPFTEDFLQDWVDVWLAAGPPQGSDPQAYRQLTEYIVRNLGTTQLDLMVQGDFESIFSRQYSANRAAARLQFTDGAFIVTSQRGLHDMARRFQPMIRGWVDRLYADEPEARIAVLLAQERYAAEMSLVLSLAYADEHEAYLNRVNARLRQALADAEAANRAKSEFIAAVSHEIRSPLNALVGYTAMLREQLGEGLDPEAFHLLERLAQVAHATYRLTDDLLQNARIEAGRLRLDLASVPLAPLIDQLCDDTRALVDDGEVEVTTAMHDRHVAVTADPTRLRQILTNLLSNAAKFTRTGSIRVVTAAARDGSAVAIQVVDTGAGIPAHDLPHVFDLFYRADATSETSGAGIGLFLARQLAHAMQGTLTAVSTAGTGSTFTLELPQASQVSREPARR